MGELELADAQVAGAGEGALLVAEQLALEQLRRQRGAVHLHERARPPRRPAVQLAGDDVLADAAFAAQQHADVAVGDAVHHRRHRFHRRAGAPRRPARPAGSSAALALEAGHFGAQRLALERVANRGLERHLAHAFGVAGLEHVVGRAEAHGLDDGRRRLTARQHDDLRRRTLLADGAQRFQPVHVGHGHVQQDDVRRRAGLQAVEQRPPAVVRLHQIATRLEKRGQEPGEVAVVVDDRQSCAQTLISSGSLTAIAVLAAASVKTWPDTCDTSRQASGTARPGPARHGSNTCR